MKYEAVVDVFAENLEDFEQFMAKTEAAGLNPVILVGQSDQYPSVRVTGDYDDLMSFLRTGGWEDEASELERVSLIFTTRN
jgi:hypothetical protein